MLPCTNDMKETQDRFPKENGRFSRFVLIMFLFGNFQMLIILDILFGILGGLDYLASTLGLPRWSKTTDFCCLCKLLGGLPWEDFRLDACEWVGQQWRVPSWRMWPQKPTIAFFSIPGVTALNVCYGQVLFGGCLFLLCDHCMDGSPDQNVLVLWEDLKSF